MSSAAGPTSEQIDQLKLRQIIADIDLKREQLMQMIVERDARREQVQADIDLKREQLMQTTAERDARREQVQADIGLKREQIRLEPRRFRLSVWGIVLQGIGVAVALGGVCVALGVAIGHGWR